MPTRTHVGLAALALVPLAGCYEPNYVEGLRCSAETDYACPPGQSCFDVGGGVMECHYMDVTRVDAGDQGICTLVPQSGCGDGRRCTVNKLHDPVTLCVPDGGKTLGEACVGFGQLDECTSGLVCLDRVCRQLCVPSVDGATGCSFGTEQCIDFFGWGSCMTSCDVLAQNCSIGAHSCYLNEVGQTYCLTTESDLPLGATCNFTSECSEGKGCYGGVCRAYCQAPGGSCPGSQICTLEFANPNNIGLCK
jgi:hypothetical protein